MKVSFDKYLSYVMFQRCGGLGQGATCLSGSHRKLSKLNKVLAKAVKVRLSCCIYRITRIPKTTVSKTQVSIFTDNLKFESRVAT